DVFSKHSNIKHKIINNKKRTLATGWNIGVLEANGKFVCRVDAHSDIPNNYISKLLDDYFNIMQFDDSVVGVGGVLTNSYKTKFGSIVADFYASKFGVGNSPFRCVDKNNRLKKTDTAVFALYNKDVFFDVGLFNEVLDRNQDIDFHKRVLSNNLSLYTDNSLFVEYYVRDNFKDFIKKGFLDGFWVVMSGAYYFRHIVPLFFVLYLIVSFSLFFATGDYIYLSFLFFYFLISILFSIRDGRSFIGRVFLPFIFLSYHISYGCGSLLSFLKRYFK
ncbi:glycosyltransferase family 2 protein, partial [Shigella sonnei]|nr:glycosyltransferase family 2 protein [Shigella sonnei]